MLSQDSMHFIQRPCYQRRFSRQSEDMKSSLTIVKRHKLQWYGRDSHWSGLAKTMCQGTVKGRGRQGRQRRLWEDNIREWTGLEIVKPERAAENKEKWRKLLVKTSVVPQWPPRLRNRWSKMRSRRFTKRKCRNSHTHTHTFWINLLSRSYQQQINE